MRSRYTEDYLVETRTGRLENYSAWHDRIDQNDSYIRGEFPVIQPDGSTNTNKPIVGNLMDEMPRDLARLSSEVEPVYKAPVFGDTKDHVDNALIRGIATQGYFKRGRFEVSRPQLIMDLAVSGAAFIAVWADDSSPYPRMLRIDPRGCYPDIHNGEIQDLLVVQKLKVRVADRLFPDSGILRAYTAKQRRDPEDIADYVEIWDYYAPDEVTKSLALVDTGRNASDLLRVGSWKPDLKRGGPPVAFAQVPSPDGALRGLLDQIGPGLVAKNQIASFILEYTEQMVHSPFEHKGIVNPTDPPGPDTLYAHDPNSTTETFMRRVAPAQTNPQLFGFMELLDAEQRAQLGFPAARQGNVQQSIVSNAGIQGMQGQYSSLVREVQRMLGDLQEQAGCIAQEVDCKELDFEKPLIRNIGRKRTYTPTKVFGEEGDRYGIEVNYGAGSGLDRVNTDVRLLQLYSAGAISLETLLENVDFISDAPGEIEKRQREETLRIVLQRWAADPNTSIDFMLEVQRLMSEEALDFEEALQAANEQMAAQMSQEAEAQGQLGAASGGTPALPPDAEQMSQGAQPAGPPVAGGGFAPMPLSNVVIHGGNSQ